MNQRAADELSEDTVRELASLARVGITPGEATELRVRLTAMLEAFAVLERAPVEPWTGDSLEWESPAPLREDVPSPDTLDTTTFLEAVPEREGVFVRVPAILERST